MEIQICNSSKELGAMAAIKGADAIREALKAKHEASIILATGASQFDMLSQLVKADLDWSKVTCFHLDEYVGIQDDHPASFRKYLRERFLGKVGKVRTFNFIDPGKDPHAECSRLNRLISSNEIDVAFVGIGENGHLAFNDPPADVTTEVPYLVVNLDHDCRVQQLGEGWFPTLDDVPMQAISMSIHQIMKSRKLIAAVPDLRKSKAVQRTVEGNVTPLCPASIMQLHPDCHLYLDRDSSSLLTAH
jgi:glucosamine-6-phosphate deaminase